GFSMTGFSPFISTRAVPDTIITCSVGVCQCHGKVQPAAAFARITDGPFDGSPLSTVPCVHDGIAGNGANFASAAFRVTGASSARAAPAKRRATGPMSGANEFRSFTRSPSFAILTAPPAPLHEGDAGPDRLPPHAGGLLVETFRALRGRGDQ